MDLWSTSTEQRERVARHLFPDVHHTSLLSGLYMTVFTYSGDSFTVPEQQYFATCREMGINVLREALLSR